MAETAAQLFFATSPKPAQLALLHWALMDDAESLLNLRAVNKTFHLLSSEYMISRFSSTKVVPSKTKAAGSFADYRKPPTLTGGDYLVMQGTGYCIPEGLWKQNECRYPLSAEGIANASNGQASTIKLVLKSIDEKGICTFEPVAERGRSSSLNIRGMANTEGVKPYLYSDVRYNCAREVDES